MPDTAPATETKRTDWTLGLDLGQTSDYSALVAVESQFTVSGWQHDVRHIRRWPLGTTYPSIVADVVELMATAPLDRAETWCDGTGVGKAVVDMFRDQAIADRLHPLTITSGHSCAFEDGYWRVPKKDLVAVIQAPLQAGRLRFAAGDPNVRLLTSELTAFRATITTAANISFEAWRERDHDDLVLALAIALWGAARAPAPLVAPIGIGNVRRPWNDNSQRLPHPDGASRWQRP